METPFFSITAIIIIVFGILQIILFFKIWGMTNDVKKLKNTIQANGYPDGSSPAKIELAMGNIDKAKELALREFIFDVHQVYSDIVTNSTNEDAAYAKRYQYLEIDYRDKFPDASTFIDFTKYDSFDKVKRIFRQ
ncbi:hypothetical protein [Bacteroides reticulotermitis]|uniref:hypothetical protein n=1 Tax=Bacteroides reticulotermitis TaxID=1133319 RepID=UPI003A85D671